MVGCFGKGYIVSWALKLSRFCVAHVKRLVEFTVDK